MAVQEGHWPWETDNPDQEPAEPEPPATVIPFPTQEQPLAAEPPSYQLGPEEMHAFLEQDAVGAIVQFLQQQGPDRGPFRLGRDGEQNQQLPGVTLPPWMMQSFNFLCGHPLLPYNHDRPTMIRDLLFMGLSGMVQALQGYLADPELNQTRHIISHEAKLRRYLHEEEMLQNHFVEDLAIAARALELRMDAHQPEAVFEQLQNLFEFVLGIREKHFWQPTFLRFMIRIPEIRNAMNYLGEQDQYQYDQQYRAWVNMMAEEAAQRRDWDREYDSESEGD